MKNNKESILKKKLWGMFSQYIRLKDADEGGMVTCCDTGERKHWKTIHCGHLFHNSERSQSLGGNELWFYEKNFAPQSVSGNYFNAGDASKKYMLWAVKKYGVKEIDKMQKLKITPKKWTYEELSKKYDFYKQKVKSLQEDLGASYFID